MIIRLLCFSLVLFTIGCASTPRQVTMFSLNLNKEISSPETQKDVSIRILPVTWDNIERFPQITAQIPFRYESSGSYYPSTELWALIPMPAFEVTIINNTKHVLRLNNAVIKLQDGVDDVYDVAYKEDIKARAESIAYQDSVNRGIYWDLATIKSRISAAPLLTQNSELLPGITKKAYVSFNIPVGYRDFMAGKSYLKVLFFEIPVETDKAGSTTETVNYTFYYDITANTVTVQ